MRVIEKIRSDALLTHMVAFHAQQSIEKSIKAVVEEFELGAIRIHSLERLIEITQDHIKLNIDIIAIQKLDKLYIDARYPGNLGLLPDGKPTVKDAEEFYAIAKNIYVTVKDTLKSI